MRYELHKRIKRNRFKRWIWKLDDHQKIYIALAFIIATLGVCLIIALHHNSTSNYFYTLQRKGWLQSRQTLQNTLKSVEQQKAVTESQLQQKAATEADLKSQIDSLNKQLQAKAEKQQQQTIASRVINAVSLTQTVHASAVISGCGDNQYANFIYMHESGCNLNAVNSLGCRGIGQACPGSKLPCGADYACQNAYFTAYANSRYGGWAGAYSAWLGKSWW